jgi:hypothetical protein
MLVSTVLKLVHIDQDRTNLDAKQAIIVKTAL